MAAEEVAVFDMAKAVRARLEDADWDTGIFLTDLPRRARLVTVTAEVDRRLGVALVPLSGGQAPIAVAALRRCPT